MVGNFLGCLFVLFILFGLLCNLTDDENKGMQIINNCVTAIVIYSMIIVIFSAKNSEIIKLNIPFWNGIVKYGTLKSYLKASAGGFALDFIQLVTLVLLINWVSNIMSFDKAGFIGILTSKFIIVFIGILIYGFIMQFIEKNIFFKLAVYAIECIITGGSIVVTPLLIIKTITGTKQEAFVNAYILDSLKQSNIGKAITASMSSSIVILVFMYAMNLQYGGVNNVLSDVMQSFSGIAGIIIVLMGIYFIVKSITTKRKK